MQLMATLMPDAPKVGFPTMLAGMVRKDGVKSIYAGLSAALMRQAIYGTARIGLHRTFSDKLVVVSERSCFPANPAAP
jgi:solute carrier family 25 oxoglutarate transporter 11